MLEIGCGQEWAAMETTRRGIKSYVLDLSGGLVFSKTYGHQSALPLFISLEKGP